LAVDIAKAAITMAIPVPTAPSVTLDTGAGTGAVGSATGFDSGGTLSITTGATPAASALVATVTFSEAFGSAPVLIELIPANDAASNLGLANPFINPADIVAGSWKITSASVALPPDTALKWYFAPRFK